ncbi:MAG: serine/threonine-protein kinase [Solirubrobacteraceae bacterium]
MGTVYRGRDLVLGRTVAVKVIADGLDGDARYAARFEREARIAAKVSHPAVVTVFDSGVDDGVRFIVMEHVAGASLSSVLRERGRLAVAEAAEIGSRVAGGLAAIHAAGLIHRDLKPSNVMLGDEGAVKVLDFGVAYAPAATALTQTAAVLGSVPYIAPEQASGQRGDARSDVYSLGCLVYALLAGGPPFATGSAPALLHQHVHAAPPPLRDTRPDVPPRLETLTSQMLAKRASERPQSAEEVRDELAAIASGELASEARPRKSRLDEPAAATGATRAMPGVVAAATGATRAMPGVANDGDDPSRRALGGRRRALSAIVLAAVAAAAIAIALTSALTGGGNLRDSGKRGGATAGRKRHRESTATAARASSSKTSTLTTSTTAAGTAPTAATSSTAGTSSTANGGPSEASSTTQAPGEQTRASAHSGDQTAPSEQGPAAGAAPAASGDQGGGGAADGHDEAPEGARGAGGGQAAGDGGTPPGHGGRPPGHGGVPPGHDVLARSH